MASGVFSSIQFLSTNLLHAIRGTTSTSHQQDPPSPVRKDLEKLSRMLPRIQAVLQDAEEREIHDCSVRLWLAELRGVAYKAEDVLDEFYYEVLRSIVEGGDAAIEAYHRGGGTKIKCAEMYTSSSLASYPFTITKAPIPDGMTEKIKGITEKFEEISNDRHALQLKEEDGTRLIISPQIRPPTSSHVDKRTIFGREEEKDKIISLLDPSNGPDFMVLPIVGMGGFGKTTLAQLVYIDSRIHGWFNKRCWVSVSDDFDLVRLTKAIVESVSDNPCEFSELSKLQDVLMERIRDIGLFLVLDDVWNEKRKLWECFRVGLFGAKFVRILTTTRNTSVAKIMQTTLPFQLSSLPEENCWSIFKHFAFDNRVISENANLHEIGRGIVKKCKGSPLATKVLGGILCYETNEEKWREILESDISEIDKTGEIMPALRLSYEKLPRNLKPCFLYLSMFPKDTQFGKDMVVRLWIAQGYINGNTRNLKTLEAIGSEYFDELQCRSLVDGGPSSYILHDLIHDLARSVSQEAYRPILENDQEYNGPCKVYHLYFPEKDELWGSFLVPNYYCSIRTFVAGSQTMNSAFFYKIACVRTLHLHLSSLPNTLGTLKHLRSLYINDITIVHLPESLCLLYHLQTLDIDCNDLAELPENIKTLVNLQFLQLCSSKIKQLPESISLLHNLHTLSIKRCPRLEMVPKGTEKLTKLRVKLSENCICIIPCGIGILTNLRNLSGNFIMGSDITWGLGEFGNMNWLSGLMSISGLKNVGNIEYSRKANLISKSNLHKLILNFEEDDVACRNFLRDRYGDKFYYITISSSTNAKNENDEKIQEGVLESLQPHGNLIELVILNYGEIRVPYWLLDPSLMSELTTLTLHFHTELTFLPPLMDQLPHLKSLKIFGSVTKVRYDHLARSTLFANDSSKQCAAGVSFSSREKPFSSYIFYLVEWQAVDEPGLKKLIIKNCSKLREVTIPQKVDVLEVNKCGCQEIKFSSPSELKKLSISDCRELITIYYKSGDLPFLESISISGCPNLSMLSAIPKKVEVLEVNACGCQEIKFSSPSELKKLSISKCRELITIYYKIGDLPFLENISLSGCPKLSMLSAIPPKVEALKLNTCGCKEIKFSSPSELKRLSISDCRELISIYYKIGDLHFLENISLSGCPKLSMLSAIPPKVEALKLNTCCCKEIKFSSPSELRKLSISNCRELITIYYKSGDLPFLKSISLSGCSKLSILPAIPQELEQLYVANCGFQEINFLSLSKLKNISIFRCRELVSIYYKIGDLPFLESISLSGCPKLLVFSAILEEMKQMHKRNSGFQSEIQNVSISDCGIREIILPSRCWLLEIHNCLELISVHWRDGDSSSLPLVKFVDCPQLKLLKIPKEVEILQIKSCGTHEISFSSQSKVRRVDIHHCPELFSVLWMDGAIPFLKDLFIEGCPALWSILVVPNKKHQLGITECGLHEIQFPNQCKIASVHRSCCPELISLQFLQGDLPLLEKFAIKSCPQFHEVLTIPYQLKELKIVDCQFPEIHLLPQSNLRRLIIRDCSNLTAIKGLQAQFPTGDLLPPMMERVEIRNCPRMDFGTQGNSYFYQVMQEASQDLLMFPLRANDHESGGSYSQDSEHAVTQTI